MLIRDVMSYHTVRWYDITERDEMRKLMFFLCFLVSFSAMASGIADEIIIKATPSSEGTVVAYGKPKYQKTFELVVMSKSKKPLNLTKENGCYKAFDSKNNEFHARTIHLSLLGELTNKAVKEGSVTFVSDSNAVYGAQFVKWDSECVVPAE